MGRSGSFIMHNGNSDYHSSGSNEGPGDERLLRRLCSTLGRHRASGGIGHERTILRQVGSQRPESMGDFRRHYATRTRASPAARRKGVGCLESPLQKHRHLLKLHQLGRHGVRLGGRVFRGYTVAWRQTGAHSIKEKSGSRETQNVHHVGHDQEAHECTDAA